AQGGKVAVGLRSIGVSGDLVEQRDRLFAAVRLERNARARHLGGNGGGVASVRGQSREIVFRLVDLTGFELVERGDQSLRRFFEPGFAPILPEQIAAESRQREDQRAADGPAIALGRVPELVLADRLVHLPQQDFLLGGAASG